MADGDGGGGWLGCWFKTQWPLGCELVQWGERTNGLRVALQGGFKGGWVMFLDGSLM